MTRWLRILIPVLMLAVMSACTVQPVMPVASSAATAAPAEEAAGEATAEPSEEGADLSGELIVFAAASLTDAFGKIAEDFQAEYPDTTISYNFAGSQQLAQQLGQGAPADVFASANAKQMQVAVDAGRVVSGTARTFVRNRLVVIYPKDNPAGITTLQDLAKPGVKLVLAAPEVPVGGYSLDFLKKASADVAFGEAFSETVISNVVSYEDNVRSVLSKVALGEADAGIVYTSDVSGDGADQVGQLEIPDALNTIASYPIATISDSANPELAKAFMDYVLDEGGQTVLVAYGFIPTIGTATGERPVAMPLAITGAVSAPVTLSADDLKALPQVTISATDKNGAAQEYTGVALATLLEQAGVDPAATTLVFVGGDGYTAEVALADAMADTDAVIAIDENGSARNIFPSMPPKSWVKGLVEIQVK